MNWQVSRVAWAAEGRRRFNAGISCGYRAIRPQKGYLTVTTFARAQALGWTRIVYRSPRVCRRQRWRPQHQHVAIESQVFPQRRPYPDSTSRDHEYDRAPRHNDATGHQIRGRYVKPISSPLPASPYA